MDREKIITCLTALGFSRLEAEIYIVLLDGAMSGYQIAKKIDTSRPSVYNALEHMYDRGIVMQIKDGGSEYISQPPSVIFKALTEQYTQNAVFAERTLTDYYENRFDERLSSFKGFKAIEEQAKRLIASTEKEIFINTDLDISIFSDEINMISDNGCKVYIFSFINQTASVKAEIFSHGRKPIAEPTRLMLCADCREALIAGKSENVGWLGTLTNNSLITDIITEHIHNDIYLLRLRNMYGAQFYKELRIGSDFEKLDRVKS